MATPIVYVLCDKNCKFEGMTKEQIISAIMQAVSTGRITNVDAGFVSKVKTINGKYIKFFIGPQSEYDALSEADKKDDLFAIVTNDTTKEGLLEAIKTLETWKNEVENGEKYVPKATSATNAGHATTADTANALSFGLYMVYMRIGHTDPSYMFNFSFVAKGERPNITNRSTFANCFINSMPEEAIALGSGYLYVAGIHNKYFQITGIYHKYEGKLYFNGLDAANGTEGMFEVPENATLFVDAVIPLTSKE